MEGGCIVQVGMVCEIIVNLVDVYVEDFVVYMNFLGVLIVEDMVEFGEVVGDFILCDMLVCDVMWMLIDFGSDVLFL